MVLGTQMGVRMNYAKVTKRIAAYLVDQAIFLVCCSFFFLLISFILPEESFTNFFNYIFPDTDIDTELISKRYEILEDSGTLLASLVYIALEVLMIIRLGWTPGKLLFGIYIKDATTLKNIAFMQVVIRSTFKTFLFVFFDTYEWFLILPILILILVPVIFDQRKQFFYDKIAKTVVMDYRSEEYYPRLNYVYVGITRRAIAYIIDHFIIKGTLLVFVFFLAEMTFLPFKFKVLIMCLRILLSILLEVLMVKRFGGTPGQLLCRIRIKDADTIENVTLTQAIIRCVSFEVICSSIFIMRRFSVMFAYEWWFDPLPDLILMIIMLIFMCAISDQRKQFFHDKIAKTVAVNYCKSSS